MSAVSFGSAGDAAFCLSSHALNLAIAASSEGESCTGD
jgi:hypothetical protein